MDSESQEWNSIWVVRRHRTDFSERWKDKTPVEPKDPLKSFLSVVIFPKWMWKLSKWKKPPGKARSYARDKKVSGFFFPSLSCKYYLHVCNGASTECGANWDCHLIVESVVGAGKQRATSSPSQMGNWQIVTNTDNKHTVYSHDGKYQNNQWKRWTQLPLRRRVHIQRGYFSPNNSCGNYWNL